MAALSLLPARHCPPPPPPPSPRREFKNVSAPVREEFWKLAVSGEGRPAWKQYTGVQAFSSLLPPPSSGLESYLHEVADMELGTLSAAEKKEARNALKVCPVSTFHPPPSPHTVTLPSDGGIYSRAICGRIRK